MIASGTSEDTLTEALTTPGVQPYRGDSGEVMGMTCAPDYDDTATNVDIVVIEPDGDGDGDDGEAGTITVEITERNDNSDVTVTTGFAPI